MININNKQWEELEIDDIKYILSQADDETFFFEFKADDTSTEKIMKEISAFSNTYGGYVFLGINNDKTIGGCVNWTEDRIHTTIHDSITPVPLFDVRKINYDNGYILIIKIEEGIMPPYITNKGKIYERISSGSYVIKESSKLTQLYYKREDQLKRIKNKIELDTIERGKEFPDNLFGYVDLGFSLTTAARTKFQENFYRYDFSKTTEYLKNFGDAFSVSCLGDSYLISLGTVSTPSGQNIISGLHHFIEIMYDGSIRLRITLFSEQNTNKINVADLAILMLTFKEIYLTIFDDPTFLKLFVYAHKYQKLMVFRQFIPYFQLKGNSKTLQDLVDYFNQHDQKYGSNRIIIGNRVPRNDFQIIDKRSIQRKRNEYNNEMIFDELFSTEYFHLGFVLDDTMPQKRDSNND